MDATQSTLRGPRLYVLEPWKIWTLLGAVLLLAVASVALWTLTSRARPAAPVASAPVSAPVAPSIEPSALAPSATRDLAVSLTRTVDGPNGSVVEVTYGDPILLRAMGEQPPVLASGDAALAFLFNESVHEGELSTEHLTPLLRMDGSAPQAPTDTVVQIEDPHHRVTVFLYPATALPMDGASHTLSLVLQGENAALVDTTSLTWRLPLPQEAAAAVQRSPQSPLAVEPVATSNLAQALTRTVGDAAYGGVRDIQVRATYATAEYLRQTAGADAPARYNTDEAVFFLVAETSHTDALPKPPLQPTLRLDGRSFAALGQQTVTDSSHHRVTLVRFPKDSVLGRGRQVMELALPSGQTLQWRLPLVVSSSAAAAASGGFHLTWVSVLAILGGVLAAMWPCLFQLTAYFIPTMAGVNVHGGGGAAAAIQATTRVSVLKTALFFVMGFTIVYTTAGALIGFGAQQLGQFPSYQVWLRYVSIGAGIILFGLALRIAARARMPLVCKMPVLSRMSGKAASPWENMVAGLAFATGCMTCFGSAVLIGVFLYAGIAASPLYGALILFLFSLGMGIPLVVGALAMARVLPLLFRIESLARWMGYASAAIIATFGILMISGNFMLVSRWAFKLVPAIGSLAPAP